MARALIALTIITMAGIVWLAVATIWRRRRKANSQQTDTSEAVLDNVPGNKADHPALDRVLPILAADALLPAGDSTHAALQAAIDDKRADLHPTLVNAEGLPIFAAEVADLEPDMVDESVPEQAQHWKNEYARTLVLAATLVTRFLAAHADTIGADGADTRDANNPMLQIEWWLPAHWHEDTRSAARRWLGKQLADTGWDAARVLIQTCGMAPGSQALARLDSINQAWQDGAFALPVLLLASASNVGESTIAHWQSEQLLFDAERGEGRIPGEGAAALLLAASGHTAATAQAHVHRLFSGQRQRPVDAAQRVQADTLSSLLQAARHHAHLPDEAALQLLADSDLGSSRTAEALHLADNSFAEEDPSEMLRTVGAANGDCGAVLTLALIAVATELCTQNGHATLVFSNCHPSQRLALLVTPPTMATVADHQPTHTDT